MTTAELTRYEELVKYREAVERDLIIAKQTVSICEAQRETIHNQIGALIGVPVGGGTT